MILLQVLVSLAMYTWKWTWKMMMTLSWLRLFLFVLDGRYTDSVSFCIHFAYMSMYVRLLIHNETKAQYRLIDLSAILVRNGSIPKEREWGERRTVLFPSVFFSRHACSMQASTTYTSISRALSELHVQNLQKPKLEIFGPRLEWFFSQMSEFPCRHEIILGWIGLDWIGLGIGELAGKV